MLKRATLATGALIILLLAGVSGYLLVEVDSLRGEIETVRQDAKRSSAGTTALMLSLLPDPKVASGMSADIDDLRNDIQDLHSCLNSLGITPTTSTPDWILAQYGGGLTCRVT